MVKVLAKVEEFSAELLAVADAHRAAELIDTDVDQQPQPVAF
jgi:hypothetical protein